MGKHERRIRLTHPNRVVEGARVEEGIVVGETHHLCRVAAERANKGEGERDQFIGLTLVIILDAHPHSVRNLPINLPQLARGKVPETEGAIVGTADDLLCIRLQEKRA